MLDFSVKIDPTTGNYYIETSLKGKALLTIPQLNKGTAFTEEERHTFRLSGKLPAHIEKIDQQAKRVYEQYQAFTTPLQKNNYLNKIQDSNQTLFYYVVEKHISEMLPILYTPTVGEAVQQFSREFRQARGLYITYHQRHQIDEILENRSHPEVDLIVTTDGGGVLGIGDQGAGAMLIPVAKLVVYTACGGISPLRTLPIMLDVGTDNESLHHDPFYLGWRHPRIKGEQYDEFIALFVDAVKRKFPNVFLHWEDFGISTANRILQTYKDQICSFNDDIQGTGAVTLSAILAACLTNKSKLSDQKIIIFGAGSAGTGIANQIYNGMLKEGLNSETAHSRFWLIDRPGLLSDKTDLTLAQAPFARTSEELKQWEYASDNPNLLEVIKNVQPTVLIGCSTLAGAFNQDIVTEMAKYVERPIIFPLSNPTSRAEATPASIIEWTDAKALVATGSPFDEVKYKDHVIPIAQCNNALVFPGIGLGVVASKATKVSDEMLWAACQALSHCAPVHDNPLTALLPPISDAKSAAREIAIQVAEQARREGVAGISDDMSIEQAVDKHMWTPAYLPYRRSKV